MTGFLYRKYIMNITLNYRIIITVFLSLSFTVASAHEHKKTGIVLDKNAQSALTPEAVLEDLMAGNERYVKGNLTNYENVTAQIKATTDGQFPQAIILSCVDSRVPVELVFDQRIGDVFVARVAGNMENVDILGSMEFATAGAGVKLIMVLGHQACGAVKGACDYIDYVRIGNLSALLEKIQPAVLSVQNDFPENQRNSKNAEFVDRVVHANIERTVQDIRHKSPIIAEWEASGKVNIVGAYYSLEDGRVTLVE